MLRCIRRLLFASLIASAAGASHAAELGDPRVSSHIGQQLVADIELTLIEDPGAPVGVRLASPEVYSGAGIAVPPVLASLNLSVMRRDGRQFVHATTLRPVEADHLHLYLELSERGQRVVRLATLWLTPDPNPAPAALPAPAPAVAVAAPAAAPVVAAPVPARPRVRVEAEPAPPALAWTKAPPRVAPPVRSAPPAAKPAPLPLPVIAPAPAPAHPAACVPRSGEAEACAALGAKNAELRARLNVLEQRVTGLQTRLGAEQGKPAGKAAAVAAAPASKAAPASAEPQAQKQPAPAAQAPQPSPPKTPAGPMPISAIKPLVPRKPQAAPPDEDLPWGKIGGGLAVLAAVAGAGAALVRVRRKRTRNVDIPAEPGVLPRLRERFFTRNGGKDLSDPGGEPIAEPTLE